MSIQLEPTQPAAYRHDEPAQPTERYGPVLPSGWKRGKKKISQSYWAFEQDDVSSIPPQIRKQLVKQHGSFTMAFSTAVQPALHHIGDSSGYIAYRKRWNINFALADPVAPAEQHADLIENFIASHRKPSFVQISANTAAILQRLGYFTTPMGIDTRIPLSEYEFKGKSKEWLRYASNWVARRDYQIREASFHELKRKDVAELSEAWRKTRTVKRKEVRFLNRPIVLRDEPDVRKFFLFSPEGQALAFIFIDPVYRDGQIIGYSTAFKRRHPDAPQYAEHALMKSIIETLQEERVESLYLGLSPMAIEKPSAYDKTNWLTHKIFETGYRSRIINRYCYHVQGHANYKRRFRGIEETVYYASPRRADFFRIMALIGLCGIA